MVQLKDQYLNLHTQYILGELSEREESDILAQMDDLWYKMSEEDHNYLNSYLGPQAKEI
jgi:hypothetical protein